jgi:serine/threonine-protein kinase
VTPERLRRIRAVYEAAVDTPAAGRPAALERECNGDDELRQEVERLLGARERLPDWLSSPVLGGAKAPPAEARPTVTEAPSEEKVHFPPGAVLAQRYRIVHLLGRGGMGEVYRADDLLLGQPVALKFLPAAATASASVLSRFRNEVRTARQVSHPNVCRVYDIGEAQGLTYLSMEYVDGEDLASLLRRIGKLPPDKALEIARQLCAGLAAAHDKGVVHRDLKPANIMLDGRGSVRITDFGIAGVAEHIKDIRSGTPAYMSPEQLAGKEVTPRSDIYALGLVLHELLTGKRLPLEPVDRGATELDPAVDRVIRWCLEPDPEMRPGSALAVSAALPGGDPLAAALARGETPAPEVVANAGTAEGLRPAGAVVCLAAVIIGLGLVCVQRQRHDLINQIPMENSSEVLAAKAREIAKSLGYTERPVDTLFAWNYDADYILYARELRAAPSHVASLSPYPPAVYFWYRQSARYPGVVNIDEEITVFRREALEPGMQAVVLDSEGRLLEFHARPPVDLAQSHAPRVFDWSRLFAAAGLDRASFQETEPGLTPVTPFDAQAAWKGPSKDAPDGAVRIEAAAFRGQPVLFRVLGPWARPSRAAPLSLGLLSLPLYVVSLIVIPAVGTLLAWRNARSGRGDRRGAFRLAALIFVCGVVNHLTGLHHTRAAAEFVFLFAILRNALAAGVLVWVVYMALEPEARRRCPEALISWSRVLAGRTRDPMAGGHLLIGVTLGVGSLCLTQLLTPPVEAAALSSVQPALPSTAGVVFAYWGVDVIFGIAGGLMFMFMLSLVSMAIRPRWLAILIFVLLPTLTLTPYATGPLLAVGRSIVFFGTMAIALARFGVLTAAASFYAAIVLLDFPLTTNLSAWHAQAALFALATVMVLALYGFVTTLTGCPTSPNKLDPT